MRCGESYENHQGPALSAYPGIDIDYESFEVGRPVEPIFISHPTYTLEEMCNNVGIKYGDWYD